MKEFYYRKFVRMKNQPSYIALKVISWLLLIFTGPLAAIVQIFKSTVQTCINQKTQVDFIVPRKPKDIKKESFGAAYAIALEAIVGLTASIPWMMVAYKYTIDRYIGEPIITLLFYLVIIANIYRSEIYAEVESMNKKVLSDSFFRFFKANGILGNIAGFFGSVVIMGYFVCLNGAREAFLFMEKYRIMFLGVLVVSLVSILADATLAKRKWNMGDYTE
ncbi:MAG: hypothetical protein HDT41_04070 [Lachnospiraceae bacterium]|nr:hypothetical protein [Lachnospiraceae bacterium]